MHKECDRKRSKGKKVNREGGGLREREREREERRKGDKKKERKMKRRDGKTRQKEKKHKWKYEGKKKCFKTDKGPERKCNMLSIY